MSFIRSWGSLIKRLIGVNAIFGGRATKLAGINDFAAIATDIPVVFAAPNQIVFPAGVPTFLQTMTGTGKLFKVTYGGGPNDGSIFRMVGIVGNTITVTNTAVIGYAGTATLDGRIWMVIDDPSIAKPTSTGSTMFNVHNRNRSVLGNDASEVAFVFAEHYHGETEEEDLDDILFHERNEIGERSLITSSCSGTSLDIGPLAVVDRHGDAVRIRAKDINPVEECFPYPCECPGQPCEVV